MTKLQYSLKLKAKPHILMKLMTEYEYMPNYLPDQLKSMKIVEKNGNNVITEEEMFFSTVFKSKIVQRSIHKKISDKELYTEVISGPAKGTNITIFFAESDAGTEVSVNIDLKLNLKMRILSPLIKKWYKMISTAILYKMNSRSLNLINENKEF